MLSRMDQNQFSPHKIQKNNIDWHVSDCLRDNSLIIIAIIFSSITEPITEMIEQILSNTDLHKGNCAKRNH